MEVIANAWKNERWDLFCLVTPNWTITLPDALDSSVEPDAFMKKDDFVRLLENWAKSFLAPVMEGVCVSDLSRTENEFKIVTDLHEFFLLTKLL